MADIFGYNRSAAAGVFVADKSKLTITGDGVSGVDLIQGWQVGYQQGIQPIYEVGSSRIFWAKTNPQGTGSISRIVGSSFLRMASDICDKGATVQISNTSGSCDGGEVTLTCIGAICTSIGFSTQAGSPTVSQNVSFQFTSLSV